MSTFDQAPSEWVNVIQQLWTDIKNVAARWKLAIHKIMDTRSPVTDVAKYIEETYPIMMANTTLTGWMSCHGLQDSEWNLLLKATFIERNGDLLFTHEDDTQKVRTKILHEIVFMIKLLNEGFKGDIPKKLNIKDILTPHHIKMLDAAKIEMKLTLDDNERSIVLSRMPEKEEPKIEEPVTAAA